MLNFKNLNLNLKQKRGKLLFINLVGQSNSYNYCLNLNLWLKIIFAFDLNRIYYYFEIFKDIFKWLQSVSSRISSQLNKWNDSLENIFFSNIMLEFIWLEIGKCFCIILQTKNLLCRNYFASQSNGLSSEFSDSVRKFNEKRVHTSSNKTRKENKIGGRN